MSELIHLEPQPLEVRDLEKREVSGRIIPYGEQISVRGRPESFTQGALAEIQGSKVKLFDHHERAVGKMTELEERQDGAYGTFYVSKTNRGNELLELASDGVLSFSPGFLPGTQTRDGVHTRIRAMPEVSLVSMPAYSKAEVLSVREKEHSVPETTTETPSENVVVDLSPLETRMDDLSTQIEKLQSVVDAPPPAAPKGGPKPLDWFAAQVDAVFNGKYEKRDAFDRSWSEFQTRALDDITGVALGGTATPSDASGLLAEEYLASQLVNVLDARRPLFSRLGSFPMPRSGYAQIPVVTQHTEVDDRAGQKQAANSRKLIVISRSFEAEWVDGAVDIAIELIRSAELPVLDLVWNDLLGQYAIRTESKVVEQVEAGGLGFTYTGTALLDGSPTYAEFAEAVATQAMVVRTNSGLPATKLAVTEAQWPKLVAMVDANDRRQFTSGDHSDGNVNLTAESFTLPGGIEVFYVPDITAAMLFNEASLKAADGGPERVEAVNVELMGRDLGILGRIIFVPRIPSAVVVFGADPES